MSTPPLKLYRASAGSGKTFTLTVEYITLLIVDPTAYRHILAVTFTNKATAEMKSRILSTLEALRDSSESAQSYFEKISQTPEVKALNISDTEIRKRAGIALHYLSHDYSRFHIETIDSFFISVIKDLAHELNLPANLSVDLNSEDVLSEAVDNIIDDPDADKSTFQSIIDFIREKIDEEKNWKLDEEIKSFGQNIFNEKYLKDYHLISDKIDDKAFMHTYKQTLRNLKEGAISTLQKQGKLFIQICDNHGYSIENFKQKKSGVYGFFQKLSTCKEAPAVNSYVRKCIEDPAEWNKSDTGLQHLAVTTLMPLLQKTLDLLPEAAETIATVNAISRHLNHLQLLTAISREIERLNLNANRFLLAHSAYFLQRMINKSSVPFIYEKSGTRFSHIMIDEFQDTSQLQWSNFLPLLLNSLDSDNACLIVGDVKQSIYRFRNSDWNILNTLTDTPLLRGKIHTPPPLNTNRRSKGNIITFNNTFFTQAVSEINNDYRQAHDGTDCIALNTAYSDVEQHITEPNRNQGYVNIDIITDGDSYEATTLQTLVAHIDQLLDQGLQQKDITILLRFNKHIFTISQYISDHAPHLRLISDEAYKLSSSVSINIIMSALRYLLAPDDRLALLSLVANTTTRPYSDLLVLSTQQLTELLPESFLAAADTLPYTPIKDLIEAIYDYFDLKSIPQQDAYLFYFHDQITTFLEDRRNDISTLLQYWDDKLSKKTIPGNSDADGIRIMSIHKSKGLEFHTVILPFCDWNTTGKYTDLMWCTPGKPPYSQIPLIPINYIKGVQDSIFRDEYEEETLRNNVDNLNLLYVAFTRPVNNLFVITSDAGKKKKKSEKSDKPSAIENIAQLITRVAASECLGEFQESEDSAPTGPSGKSGESGAPKAPEASAPTRHLYFGTPITTRKTDSAVTNNESIQFTTSSRLPEIRQSNKSKDFIASLNPQTADDTPRMPQRTFIDRGLLYHSILQQINTTDDIQPTITKMYMEGVFTDKAECLQADAHIREALADPFASQWFDSHWTVLSERTILQPETDTAAWSEHRPDRIITSPTETICIDYKTGTYRSEHRQQVRRYMKLLQKMGYPKVSGYLWYIMEKKTIEVTL